MVLLLSRFNEAITQALREATLKTLTRHGVARGAIRSVWVPGAFELPVAAASVASTLRPHAMIALGCVLKGETLQYAAIGQAVAQGLMQVAVNTGIPISFGVIVAESMAQVRARAGRGPGNRGAEAALASLAMLRVIPHQPGGSGAGRAETRGELGMFATIHRSAAAGLLA